jgi:hypothetical protein
VRNLVPQVLDPSALVALFAGNNRVLDLLGQAERGLVSFCLPAAAVADAEREVKAGTSGWEPLLLTPGIVMLNLTLHAAVEVGTWPGDLGVRHAIHEARAVRAAVVTADPGLYRGVAIDLVSV